MIGLYRAGSSPLHRMPAGVKLAALALVAIAVSLVATTPPVAIAALGIVAVLYLAGGQGPAVFARQVWGAKWIVVLLVVTQVVFVSAEAAITVTARVLAVVLLAGLVTLTTRMSDLLETLERGLRPVRHLGIDPARIAFVLSLTIAAIPVVAELAGRVRDARRARGVRLGLHGVVTMLVLVLRHADDLGDALSARGLA